MLTLLFWIMPQTTPLLLFEFNPDRDLNNWIIVNDGVMGGLSQSRIGLTKEGTGLFTGRVRLENNGGFASVRLSLDGLDVRPYTTMVIRLKGDGKRYQLRVRSSRSDFQSYITYFETSGQWQILRIELKDLYPTFRGQRLRMPNYPGEKMAELGFLIGNKRAEDFELELDSISLQ